MSECRRADCVAVQLLYLTLQVFQIALLVQCNLRHVLEEIANLQATQLNRDVLIQSGVIRAQIVVSHLRKKRKARGEIYNLLCRNSPRRPSTLALDISHAAIESPIDTLSYLIVVVVKRDLVLLVKIVQVLRQVTHSEFVPPLAVRMFSLVFFLHLNLTHIWKLRKTSNTPMPDTITQLASRAVPDTSLCPDATNNSLRIRDGEASSRTDSGSAWHQQLVDWWPERWYLERRSHRRIWRRWSHLNYDTRNQVTTLRENNICNCDIVEEL